MSRLRPTLDALRARGEKAAGLFLTNGFPEPSATLPILDALVEGGADFIELGMPFSDPLAEGLPIQRSSARALRHGVKMADAFRTAERFRARHQTPLVLMGYVNPVLRYGVGNFFADAASSGVDGLILPDLPPEESALVEAAAREAGISLIFLIAPNTSEDRVRLVDLKSTGFVYAVSITGLTGSALGEHDAVGAYLERSQGLVERNPLLVGFGIRSHDDAARLSRHTDGFIVGSALVDEVERLWDGEGGCEPAARLDGIRRFVRGLKHGPTVGA